MELQFQAWLALLLVVATISVQKGYAQDSSCINQLLPCMNYIGRSGQVADSCCNPLKSVITSDPDCFCSLLSNKASEEAEEAGIDVNQARQLPGRCGLHVNPIRCLSGSPTSSGNSAGGRSTSSSEGQGPTSSTSDSDSKFSILLEAFQIVWVLILLSAMV